MEILKRRKVKKTEVENTEIFTETNKLKRIIDQEALKLKKRLPNEACLKIIKDASSSTKEGKMKRLNAIRSIEDAIAVKDEGSFDIPEKLITAKQMYQLCHLSYHQMTEYLPRTANELTNIYKSLQTGVCRSVGIVLCFRG